VKIFDVWHSMVSGYSQHSVNESAAVETFRVRRVKIAYFLDNDTISVGGTRC